MAIDLDHGEMKRTGFNELATASGSGAASGAAGKLSAGPSLAFGPASAIARLGRSLIRRGNLRVRLPGGRVVSLGDGKGKLLQIAIRDLATCARIAAKPQLALGEAYMDGGLIVEKGTIYELIDLAGVNFKYRREKPASGFARWWKDRRAQANDRRAARANVAHHYDLSADLYRRFLDADMQYSCAYFAQPEMTLEQAQEAKKRHIAAKLDLRPNQRVLDIGCGWGGMALTLAGLADVSVDGVTLSTEQLATARERAKKAGRDDRVQFSLTDYRDVKGPYDRIVSVGMFEHVGRPNFDTYFENVARLLSDDGVALIHTIGRAEGPGHTQPWIAKYIFPGGYIPSLSEMTGAIERAGLIITDIEILRLHYAETLRHWRERFEAQRGAIAELYDERFCRMWEFYLSASEASFRHHGHSVFQVQLAKRVDALPITRDYMAGAENSF